MSRVTRVRAVLLFIFVAAFGAAALWLLVPPPPDVAKEEFYSFLGTSLTLMDVTLAIGSAILFLLALRNFKKELKPAYKLIGIAQLSLGVLTLVFPYVEYYYLWENFWWVTSTYMPYLVGSILMFFGARKFYHILGRHAWASSVRIVAAIIVAASVVHALIPHMNTWEAVHLNETQYNLILVIIIAPVILYIAATYMIFKIRMLVGQEYKKAFGWLAIGIGLQAFSAITILVLDTYGYENWYFASRAYAIPTIVSDIVILISAYYFNVIGVTYVRHRSLLRKLFGTDQEEVTSPTIIIFVSNMVSDLSKIERYLDDMRVVTSHVTSEAGFTAKDQSVLLNVYLNLERYLATDEPLRTISSEQVRAAVEKHFSLDTDPAVKHTFWPLLPK